MIQYVNVIVEKYEVPLGKLMGYSFVLLLASIGVGFTQFSWLSKIFTPILATVFAGSLLGLFVLPALPIVIAVSAGIIVLLAIYEAYQYRQRIEAAAEAVLSKIDVLNPPTPTPAAKPAVTPVQVVHQ